MVLDQNDWSPEYSINHETCNCIRRSSDIIEVKFKFKELVKFLTKLLTRFCQTQIDRKTSKI